VHAARAFKDNPQAEQKGAERKKLMEIIGGINKDDEDNRKLLVSGRSARRSSSPGGKPPAAAHQGVPGQDRGNPGCYSTGGAMGKAIRTSTSTKGPSPDILDTVEAAHLRTIVRGASRKSFATDAIIVLSK
jgi:hypothetical protein